MQKPGLFGMNGFMVLLLTCFSVAASAQQTGYLILIDAESKQAFTVRVGDQLFASSSHGHLVIPRLKDSSYKLNFRFLRKNINDQVFLVVIHQRDLGFQLKGNDSSYLLYNWQTRETIRPVLERDSSRMLDQGIKRDDGFSRLMAAVVNDTAVMYDTYAGNGFERDSSGSTANVQRPTDNAQRLTPAAVVTANVESPTVKGQPSTVNLQPSTTNAEKPNGSLNKDSLLAVKRQEIHLADSLNTARKTASRDSLIAARKQMAYLKDSLNMVRKAMLKDSIATVKKQQLALKDSLTAARKITRDSLLAVKKGGTVQQGALYAEKIRPSNDSLLAVNRANTVRDSLLAIENAGKLKDSLANASALRSTVNGKRSTKTLPGVKKLREVSLKISRKMVFLDIGKDGQTDTITLFVYFETKADNLSMYPSGGNSLVIQKPVSADTATGKKSRLKSTSSDSSSSGMIPKNKDVDTAGFSRALQKKTVSKPGDAACSQVATEEDTQFLRSAILKANSEQDKISVATGAFAMKCFSVGQIRFLAGLLVSDKAKYRLMDAAHLHIADRDHFPELVDMLTDKNFQRKFLVMAEKRS